MLAISRIRACTVAPQRGIYEPHSASHFSVIIGLTTPVSVWNDFGHMIVGAIAYDHLTPKVRTNVDALLRLNPSYQEWVAGIRSRKRQNCLHESGHMARHDKNRCALHPMIREST